MARLEVRSLSKTYGSRRTRRHSEPVRAVEDVSFDLERGQTLALVGESGAGKSTVGALVLRLLEPDSGTVSVDGTDVLVLDPGELRAFRRNMQMIFQDPYSSLDPRMAIGRSVSEPLKVHFGTNRSDRERRAAAVLDRVGLGSHVLDRLPHELSGGQLQRAAIGRALTLEPALIVCDEVASSLDVSVQAQVLNLLADLQSETGMSYLFISHDLAVVEVISDRVAIMQSGRIVEMGPTAEVLRNPTTDYARRLLAAIPSPDPTQRWSNAR